MSELQTLYNSVIDTFLAMARETELENDEVYRRLTQAIRSNLPDKADDLSEGSTSIERVEQSAAYALASQANRTANTALEEVREPELLPDEYFVLYGKAEADYATGNSVSIVPCEADGTAFSPVPDAIDVWITFPTNNTQTGYDIAEDDVLAYLAIPSLGGKVGVLIPVAQARPASGDYVWTSQDGVMSWVEMSTFSCS